MIKIIFSQIHFPQYIFSMLYMSSTALMIVCVNDKSELLGSRDPALTEARIPRAGSEEGLDSWLTSS